MEVREISLDRIDISRWNVRKNLQDGETDATIDTLAMSIARQGLHSPITVVETPDGRYDLVAGQRRFLAHQRLERRTIPAIVRSLSDDEATALSLVENVQRAEMNPLDKAVALKRLCDRYKDERRVADEVCLSVPTVRQYVSLLGLAPDIQEQLAAGEVTSTVSLSKLSRKYSDHDTQRLVFARLKGFNASTQGEMIKHLDPSASNLEDVVDQAIEGKFERTFVRECPRDCPHLPPDLKITVHNLLREHAEQALNHSPETTP